MEAAEYLGAINIMRLMGWSYGDLCAAPAALVDELECLQRAENMARKAA